MGIYIYYLRESTSGIHTFKFSSACDMQNYKERNADWLGSDPAWKRDALFTVDDRSDGAFVYRMGEKPITVWYDCDPLPGTLVGCLRRSVEDRRRRVVSPLSDELRRAREMVDAQISERCLRLRLEDTAERANAVLNAVREPVLVGGTYYMDRLSQEDSAVCQDMRWVMELYRQAKRMASVRVADLDM